MVIQICWVVQFTKAKVLMSFGELDAIVGVVWNGFGMNWGMSSIISPEFSQICYKEYLNILVWNHNRSPDWRVTRLLKGFSDSDWKSSVFYCSSSTVPFREAPAYSKRQRGPSSGSGNGQSSSSLSAPRVLLRSNSDNNLAVRDYQQQQLSSPGIWVPQLQQHQHTKANQHRGPKQGHPQPGSSALHRSLSPQLVQQMPSGSPNGTVVVRTMGRGARSRSPSLSRLGEEARRTQPSQRQPGWAVSCACARVCFLKRTLCLHVCFVKTRKLWMEDRWSAELLSLVEMVEVCVERLHFISPAFPSLSCLCSNTRETADSEGFGPQLYRQAVTVRHPPDYQHSQEHSGMCTYFAKYTKLALI